MTRLIIYALGMITGSIVCVLGLISLDATVHTEARIGAAILIGASNIVVVGITLMRYINRDELRLKQEKAAVKYDRKIRKADNAYAALVNLQELCAHKWPYSSSECDCEICGLTSVGNRKEDS